MKAFQGAYADRVLEVDLSKEAVSTRPLDPELASNYIGGRGFTTKIQYEDLGHALDPLGPENMLIIATGPLTGTMAPGGNRVTIGAKSPLTGILGDSAMGGFWGPELKFAGYDMIIVRGMARNPLYLAINDDHVELRDARGLWGKGIVDTEEILREELGAKTRVAAIGPAGENLVRYAAILSDKGHTWGRTGMGAVMGSKKLKAIAVRGTKRPRIAEPGKMKAVQGFLNKILQGDPVSSRTARELGTTLALALFNELGGGLPTRNWQESWFEGAKKISGEAIRERYLVKDETCFACSLKCSKIVRVPKGRFATRSSKIEYYQLVSFGCNLFNDNLESIIKANELCNDLGVDIGEMGATTAFLMECYQRGLLSKTETEGLDLSWGNADAIVLLIERVAYRKGFGDKVAEGLRRVSEWVGKGSEDFAMHIKGMSMTIEDPRVYKVCNGRLRVAGRGGDHLRGQSPGGGALDDMALPEGVSEVLFNEMACNLSDMMGVCKFPYGIYSATRDVFKLKLREGLTQLYCAASGAQVDWEYLWQAAERLLNLEKAFNIRQGLTRQADDFPKRLTEPIPSGPFKGRFYDISEAFIREYYRQRGWNVETGVPSEAKLVELGLQGALTDLQQLDLPRVGR